jgi:hypothetical protein
MSCALQFVSELNVVVNFTVKNDHNLAVTAKHRLRTAADVNNRQPTMAECDLITIAFNLACPKASAVRPSVHEPIGQAFENSSTRLQIRR